ncbi:hypothetical protein [Streptomyces cavernae]|uniref:hypothetical protein n=1 Tax=Streptomyces cavernae TaxID=2259034 RepID=UPI000FEBFAF6|nr:hypothetical protein [Streptomyces cavernae]
MADEQYRWLDRDAAERLLRGQPLEAVDAGTREEAERLAEALGALVAESRPKDGELPGEDAALAAFRAAGPRANGANGTHRAPARSPRRQEARTASDAGLVQLGRLASGRRRPRWGRPVRYGLVAAFAACMIGGVAVASGAGVLPFTDREPGPAASVTAAATPKPEKPLPTPTPSPPGRSGPTAPENPGDHSEQPGSAEKGASGGESVLPRPEDVRRGGDWWSGIVSSCRALRDGRPLDQVRKRDLEEAAKGAMRVQRYCKGVLDLAGRRSTDGAGDGSVRDGRQGAGPGSNGGGDDTPGGDDQGGDDRGGDHPGDGAGAGGGQGGGPGGGPGDGQGGGRGGGQGDPQAGPRPGGGHHGNIVSAPNRLTSPARQIAPKPGALPVLPARH